jgi:hypothetical protein
MMARKLRDHANGHPWVAGYLLLTTTVTLILIVLQALGKV